MAGIDKRFTGEAWPRKARASAISAEPQLDPKLSVREM